MEFVRKLSPTHSIVLTYWQTTGLLSLIGESLCIPITDTGTTGDIFLQLLSKIKLHSDRTNKNEKSGHITHSCLLMEPFSLLSPQTWICNTYEVFTTSMEYVFVSIVLATKILTMPQLY